MITSQSFKSDTTLGIELKTPFLSELVHLEGTVLESHEKMKDIIYETRLSFEDISPQAEFVLKKLIEHFANEKG